MQRAIRLRENPAALTLCMSAQQAVPRPLRCHGVYLSTNDAKICWVYAVYAA